MNRIGRVLCAVDFSPESHGAAEYAATLSRTLAVPMALLHSHHVAAMAAYGRAAAPDWDLWLPGPADERHELDLWVEELTGRGFDVTPLFVEGTPAGALGRNTEAGDLLIVGWGSTYGAIRSAVERLHERGASEEAPTGLAFPSWASGTSSSGRRSSPGRRATACSR